MGGVHGVPESPDFGKNLMMELPGVRTASKRSTANKSSGTTDDTLDNWKFVLVPSRPQECASCSSTDVPLGAARRTSRGITTDAPEKSSDGNCSPMSPPAIPVSTKEDGSGKNPAESSSPSESLTPSLISTGEHQAATQGTSQVCFSDTARKCIVLRRRSRGLERNLLWTSLPGLSNRNYSSPLRSASSPVTSYASSAHGTTVRPTVVRLEVQKTIRRTLRVVPRRRLRMTESEGGNDTNGTGKRKISEAEHGFDDGDGPPRKRMKK